MKQLILVIVILISGLSTMAQSHDRKNCRLNPKMANNRKDGESNWSCAACVKEFKAKVAAKQKAVADSNRLHNEASKRKAVEGKAEAEKRMKPVNEAREEQKKMGTVTITNPETPSLPSTHSELFTVVKPAKQSDTLSLGNVEGKRCILANGKEVIAYTNLKYSEMQDCLYELYRKPETKHFYIPVFLKKDWVEPAFRYADKYGEQQKFGYKPIYMVNAKGEVMFPGYRLVDVTYIGEGYYVLCMDELSNAKLVVQIYDRVKNRLLKLPENSYNWDYSVFGKNYPTMAFSAWDKQTIDRELNAKPGLSEKLSAQNTNIWFRLKSYPSGDYKAHYYVITKAGEIKYLGEF